MSTSRRVIIATLAIGGLGLLLLRGWRAEGIGEQLSGRGNAGVKVIAAASAPVELGSATTRVSLAPAATTPRGGRTLASWLDALEKEERVALILRGLRAQKPPGVLYHLYLDLPPGATPTPGDPHLVGVVNFFNAVTPPGAAPPPDEHAAFDSYDVTEIARSLHAMKRLSDQTTIAIVPVGTPVTGAKATISRVELVVHRPQDRASLFHD